jgi:hypothetical protein
MAGKAAIRESVDQGSLYLRKEGVCTKSTKDVSL